MTTPSTPHFSWVVGEDVPHQQRLTPGLVFAERYRIDGVLGQGGMGQVFRAHDLSLGRAVAIKVIRAAGWNDHHTQRFLREAELLAGLRHPGILRVHGGGLSADGPFLVTALVEDAQPLTRYAQGRPLEERLACFRSLAEALAFAHAQGVVHRDVKPDNVLVDGAGRTYLCDFGLAWAPGVVDLTRSNAMVGTPLYASPEQLLGEGDRRSPRGDVYSLGVVLYELLTGLQPFRAAGSISELCRLQMTRPAPPRQLEPEVSPPVEAVCLQALETDPKRRFADAGELRAALDDPAFGRRSRRRAWLLAPVALVALVALVAVAMGRGRGEPAVAASASPAPTSAAPAAPAPSEPWEPFALGARSVHTYERRASLRLGSGAVRQGSSCKLRIAYEVASVTSARVILRGTIERIRIAIPYFRTVLAYDGWRDPPDPRAANFFHAVEGGRLTATIDRRRGRVESVRGIDRLRVDVLIPAAKAWRAEGGHATGGSLLALGDSAIERGLLHAFSDVTLKDLLDLGLGVYLRAGSAEAGTLQVRSDLPMSDGPPAVRVRVGAARDGVSTVKGRLARPRARFRRYELLGEARVGPNDRTTVALDERYVVDMDLARMQTILQDAWGVFEPLREPPHFRRQVRVEVAPPAKR